jgi:hypothetical protein
MLDIQHEQIGNGLITLKAKSRCAVCGKAFRVQLPVAAITNVPKYPVCHQSWRVVPQAWSRMHRLGSWRTARL